MKKTFIIITTLILSLLFTSCIASSDVTYKVKYIVNDEVYLTKEVKANEKVDNIEAPEFDYYEFANWLNKETNEPYDFSLPLNNDLELIAEYSKIANLAGGEEGKYYDFSNLTDEELIEIAEKLEDVFLENMVAVPIGHEVSLKLLNTRLVYPVSRDYSEYELYSNFTGESVFRYGLMEDALDESDNISFYWFKNYLSKGLYSYEYKEDLSSYDLVPYFAKGEPVKIDEYGYIWKVYINEDFKYADGANITFEDFVETYEHNLKCTDINGLRISSILNSQKYLRGECEREDVGISYDYEEKSITFTMISIYNEKSFKDLFTSPCTGPVKFFKIEEINDFSEYSTVGEYFIKSFKNNVIAFEKNPYYNHKSKIARSFNKIEYHILGNEIDEVEMVKNNLLDICTIPKELFKEYYNSEYSKQLIFTYNSIKQFSLFINTRDETKTSVSDIILFDIDFRRALYFGVDRENLIEYYLVPDYYYICDGRYLDEKHKIIYSKEKDSKYKYNPELAVKYYVKTLEKLIGEGKIDNTKNTVIELTLSCYEYYSEKEMLRKILGEFEKLFNSQEKYTNIKIKFNLFEEKSDSDYILYGNYQIGLSNIVMNSAADSLAIWAGLGTNADSYFINSIVNDWSRDTLIEFKGELFTYEALSKVLCLRSKALIRNGEYIG